MLAFTHGIFTCNCPNLLPTQVSIPKIFREERRRCRRSYIKNSTIICHIHRYRSCSVLHHDVGSPWRCKFTEWPRNVRLHLRNTVGSRFRRPIRDIDEEADWSPVGCVAPTDPFSHHSRGDCLECFSAGFVVTTLLYDRGPRKYDDGIRTLLECRRPPFSRWSSAVISCARGGALSIQQETWSPSGERSFLGYSAKKYRGRHHCEPEVSYSALIYGPPLLKGRFMLMC